jgi:hypothetical protein
VVTGRCQDWVGNELGILTVNIDQVITWVVYEACVTGTDNTLLFDTSVSLEPSLWRMCNRDRTAFLCDTPVSPGPSGWLMRHRERAALLCDTTVSLGPSVWRMCDTSVSLGPSEWRMCHRDRTALLHDVLSKETCSVPSSSAYSLYLVNFNTLKPEVCKI